ncbi:hypothetical protein QWZ06_09515 [Chryseobacterium tructae]|uniref:hypothetical protein n=1 Tax=Chryseobacterium tructae TaxID=1037380 RepID=UPI0025B4576B|nr:hypothetical protein [Chryseobacterium tructae]MDN3692496.1 hypothetical protein [Chryseobacterium tructae]
MGKAKGNYVTLIELSSSFDVAITDCIVLLMPKESFIDIITSEKVMMIHIPKYPAVVKLYRNKSHRF